MSGQRIDITGKKFGMLTAIFHKGVDHRGEYLWACKCDCGGTAVCRSGDLRGGNSSSCGCQSRAAVVKRCTKHGSATRGHWTAEYRTWASARTRCENLNSEGYGGRGIHMCER